MARTKALAKRIAEAPAQADGSPAPLRCLMLKIDAARPERTVNSDYAFVTFEFSVALVAHDGSEKADSHYKATSNHGNDPCWAYWPHGPQWGESNISFRFGFNAKAESPECPTFPNVHFTGYEPPLEQVTAGANFGNQTVKALRMLAESMGNATSFPEAVARLMQATECTAIATHREDFEAFTGKPTPPHRAHATYRVASGIPDARTLAEDILAVALKRYAPDAQGASADD